MISFIKGQLVNIQKGSIVVENNGIGYNIFIPETVISALPQVGHDVMIHTYFLVKEDAMNLYGFIDKNDLEIFKLLITVNGIGPKGALAILSTITSDELRFAILSGDSKAISKAPGVGNKTAQRLIIELKDKIDIVSSDDQIANTIRINDDDDNISEAIQALVALGYSQTEAYKSVTKIDVSGMSVEDIIKAALKNLF